MIGRSRDYIQLDIRLDRYKIGRHTRYEEKSRRNTERGNRNSELARSENTRNNSADGESRFHGSSVRRNIGSHRPGSRLLSLLSLFYWFSAMAWVSYA